MNNVIEFPNLFSDGIHVGRVIVNVFGIDIYWYGALITLGVILGGLYALKRAVGFGMISDHVFDIIFISAVGGFIGARAYYCIFNGTNYTLITAITQIRDGGLAIYGGIIGSVLTCFIYTRIKRYRMLPVLDLAGLSFPIGQAIGRWGNFFNQEAYGAPTAGNLPWGMTGNLIASDPIVKNAAAVSGEAEIVLVHPCFLYESLWCILGFVILHFYSKKLRTFDGEIFLLYAAWYGAGRSMIESLRTDSLYLGDIKISQFVGILSSLAAIIIFICLKIRTSNKAGYKMYRDTDESKTAVSGYGQMLLLRKEKLAAIKALRQKNQSAPSVLDGGEKTTEVLHDEQSGEDN